MIASNDFLSAAGFAFEKQRGITLGPFELSAIEEFSLADANCAQLANEIWDSLAGEKPDAYRVAAYWALGKQLNGSDKPKFVSALVRELPKSAHATYQIMVALENLGERVFNPNRGGTTYDEAELNLADAAAYLIRAR
jgi:hypothetical protein